MKIQELKTFKDACEVLGLSEEKVIPDFSCFPEKDQAAMVAHSKIVLVVKAANQIANNGTEWIPDWDNSNQYKYEPWFDMEGGSSGFRFCDYDYWDSYSHVGSRLCFIDRATCEYIAEQFIDLYRDYFTK